VKTSAEAANRSMPTLYAYVRVALGPAGAARLAQEGARYQGIPAYAAHFDRMRSAPGETSVAADGAEDLQAGLRGWDGALDEVVVRSITPHDTVEETLALVRAAAPA
jgi:hypothetical protein